MRISDWSSDVCSSDLASCRWRSPPWSGGCSAMKFTLGWLKDHLDTTASLKEITDKLSMIGLEVESVADRAEALKPFTVAYVKEARQHPNADRLRVCIVDTGKGEVQVVCGAPNARSGMKGRSEEHTSELQSLMRISYAVFCLKKKKDRK